MANMNKTSSEARRHTQMYNPYEFSDISFSPHRVSGDRNGTRIPVTLTKGFSDALDSKLSEMRAWLLAEVTHRFLMLLHDIPHSRHQMEGSVEGSANASASFSSASFSALQSVAELRIPTTPKSSSPDTGNSLLAVGPRVTRSWTPKPAAWDSPRTPRTHSFEQADDYSTLEEGQSDGHVYASAGDGSIVGNMLSFSGEGPSVANKVSSLGETTNVLSSIGDSSRVGNLFSIFGSVPTDSNNRSNLRAVRMQRWANLVRKLNTPKVRVAMVKRFQTLPVWTVANRHRLYKQTKGIRPQMMGSVPRAKTKHSFLTSFLHSPSRSISWTPPWYMDCLRFFTCSRLSINPNSTTHTCWLLICLLMTLYDVIMVPVIVFFNFNEDLFPQDTLRVFVGIAWVSRIFWSLDIVMNFITGTYIEGILEMRPLALAICYAKGRFAMDFAIVLSQWVELATTTKSHGLYAGHSLGVVLRGLRFMRLMRLLRLGSMHNAFHHTMKTYQESVIATGLMISTTFSVTIIIHILGCFWYGVGRFSTDGWAYDSDVVSNSNMHNYVLSVQWAAAQVHGTSRDMERTSFEDFIATISQYVGLFIFAYVIGNATLTVLQFNFVNRWKMQAVCTRFCVSHKISPALSARIRHYLALRHRQVGISERAKEDAGLLSALPGSVRHDVVNEARWPLLKKICFCNLLEDFQSRKMKTVCQLAVSVVVALEEETVFEEGDPGKSVFIVEFGKFVYHSQLQIIDMKPMRNSALEIFKNDVFKTEISHHAGGKSNDHVLVWGSLVSEAVLWTKWMHTGDFWAIRDSTMLVCNPDIFLDIIKGREDVLFCAASYASKFVAILNQIDASDLFEFEIDLGTMLDDEETEADGHLVFLSHYKEEAGTEATLMHEALTRMISRDAESPAFQYKCPVFLDSVNLDDLGELRKHVSKSKNLVLLLTPGVLRRPWCLVEIATSFKDGVRLVPVEVQRPGIHFQYPNESFYTELKAGRILSKSDEKVLRLEGLSLLDVERSVRHVFTQIALPFSPHKSTSIRQAELSDILQRCMPNSELVGNWNVGKYLGSVLKPAGSMSSDSTGSRSPARRHHRNELPKVDSDRSLMTIPG